MKCSLFDSISSSYSFDLEVDVSVMTVLIPQLSVVAGEGHRAGGVCSKKEPRPPDRDTGVYKLAGILMPSLVSSITMTGVITTYLSRAGVNGKSVPESEEVQISRSRRALATASVFEWTCSFE